MGFAKYHEDNIKLYEERMYYKTAPTFLPSVSKAYEPKHTYKCSCPFCGCGFDREVEIANHVRVNHGGKLNILYLNNRRVSNSIETIHYIYSLVLYSFNDKAIEVKIHDDFGKEYVFWSQVGKYEYNIQNYIKNNIFSILYISIGDEQYRFKQLIDINFASIDKILSGRYVSSLFYEQISEEMFTPKEYLKFLKMLINEGKDTSDVMIRINMMNYDWNDDTKQLYWYHYLASEEEEFIPQNEIAVLEIVHQIFNGDFLDAKSKISSCAIRGNDKAGCLLALGFLLGESLTVNFQRENYLNTGLLGTLNRVLEHLYSFEGMQNGSVDVEIDEISVFRKYPLISALLELEDAINRGMEISKATYEMLRELSPMASITYCRAIEDKLAKEKILKSASKIHRDSNLLKQLALDNDYGWIYRRLSVKDGNVYQEAVKKENNLKRHKLSSSFIDSFPLNDEIMITSLGGESTVGASCFVISFHGINIMLDCGINPYARGEKVYPALDEFTKQIDYIFISHAHIDHSGALTKAHAMWPNAKIYMTSPTRVYLKYLLADMARVNNGINNEFEIDIIEIEKNAMIETLESINVMDFDETVSLSEEIKVKFHSAGHIQGAAMIELDIENLKLLYTGDFTTKNQVLTSSLRYGSLPNNVDYLITESTYIGKKLEDEDHLVEDLQNKIINSLKNGKPILLPAMAVGRSQELTCIIGTMKLDGLIDDDVELYLAGMAIPTTTQIMPFMNQRYERVIGQFKEFDGYEYPGKRSVVIASSASMTKGSASYKIANHWKNTNMNFEILYVSAIDSRTENELNSFDGAYVDMSHYSMPTHSDIEGIREIIQYTSPKVISLVHQGKADSVCEFENELLNIFDNDVIIKHLYRNKTQSIFNLYESIKEDRQ